MSDYRRFTKNDWDAFAGAEPFASGAAPWIYVQRMNNDRVELTVVIDRTGVEIHLFSGDDDEDSVWTKEVSGLTSLRAEGEMKKLVEYFKKFDYAPDLSYALDHGHDKIVEGYEFC